VFAKIIEGAQMMEFNFSEFQSLQSSGSQARSLSVCFACTFTYIALLYDLVGRFSSHHHRQQQQQHHLTGRRCNNKQVSASSDAMLCYAICDALSGVGPFQGRTKTKHTFLFSSLDRSCGVITHFGASSDAASSTCALVALRPTVLLFHLFFPFIFLFF
jgi:hypothetical protein